MRSYFITFEGIDGCGKSTQIDLFADYFSSLKLPFIKTREPGGTPVSEAVRNIILNPDYSTESPVTEALLYAASRAQLVAEKISPALSSGCSVICDRFLDSSIAYQAYARGLGESVRLINEFAVQGCFPDLTFYLDIDPELAAERQLQRGKLDRIELEGIAFQRKVYDGYKQLCSVYPNRFRIIDASLSVEDIHNNIIEIFKTYASCNP